MNVIFPNAKASRKRNNTYIILGMTGGSLESKKDKWRTKGIERPGIKAV